MWFLRKYFIFIALWNNWFSFSVKLSTAASCLYFPDEFKCSQLMLNMKKAGPHCSYSYRPVSNKSFLSKVTKRLALLQINNHTKLTNWWIITNQRSGITANQQLFSFWHNKSFDDWEDIERQASWGAVEKKWIVWLPSERSQCVSIESTD